MVSAGRAAGGWPSTCIVAQEGPFGGGRDPLPHADGLRVAGVSTLCILIKAPVPVLLEEEGVTCGFPPDGRVDAVVGDAQAVAGQRLRVAGL